MKALRNQFSRMGQLLAALVATLCFGMIPAMIAQENASSDTRARQKSAGKGATTGQSTDPAYVSQHPINCQSFATLVDNALVEWQEMQGTYLIIIARLGEGERAGNFNRYRLKNVEDYLKRDETIKYVTAEGSRVKGLGRIELYVGGKLRTVFPVEKNANTVCSGKVNPFL